MTFQQRLTARGAALVQRLTGNQGDGKDVTDPRELYIILSQAESKRNQTSVNVPLLVSEATIQHKFNHEMNIRVKGYRTERRPVTPPIHHHSSLELYDPADLPTLTLVRQSSSLEDLTTLKRKDQQLANSQKAEVTFSNLPCIYEKRLDLSFGEIPEDKSSEKDGKEQFFDSVDIVLPKIPKVLEKTLPIAKPFVPPPSPASSDPEEPVSETDRQLNGVPSELVGRARQILMEETFRERLRARGLGLNRNRSLFPRDTTGLTDLKVYDLYPGQYWELRAESLQRPEDLELDMIDRDYYRMKQKSLLKLKVMDGEWKTKSDQGSPPPPRDTHRPRKYNPKQKPSLPESLGLEEEQFGLIPMTQFKIGPVESASTSHQETDSVTGPPNSRKTNRKKLPYILSDEPVAGNVPHYEKYVQGMNTPKSKHVPSTTVVNLTINQETPPARRPKHIEKNMQRRKQAFINTDKVPTQNNNASLENGSDSASLAQNNQDVCDSEDQSSAPGRQADDSRNKKSMLTGFKKLEVFGETKPLPAGSGQSLKEVHPTRYLPKCHPPMYKLDMRNYPPRGNMIEAFFELEKLPERPKWKDNKHIKLRVIDGEVILSKVKSSTPQTPSTVTSEVGNRDTPVLGKS